MTRDNIPFVRIPVIPIVLDYSWFLVLVCDLRATDLDAGGQGRPPEDGPRWSQHIPIETRRP